MNDNFNKLAVQWAPVIFICSLLLVLVCTLEPFNFSLQAFQDGFSIRTDYCPSGFFQPSGVRDWVNNVVLFLPFGFGLAGLISRMRLGSRAILAAVVSASAGLSLAVEILQMFLPSRCPGFSDIVTNSIGGWLGFACFSYASTHISTLREKIKGCLSTKKLTLGFIGYATLIFLIVNASQNAINFSNWDPRFPLLLGNEWTGDRPWKGSVFEVYISNRAISEAEVALIFSGQDRLTSIEDSLVASYQFSGSRESYRDQTGHLPDLSWREKFPDPQDGTGVSLNSSHWLETKGPATFLTQKLRETSQFTLSAIVATAEKAQTGPARIISLSGNPYSRNFTLGQKQLDLVFRLRTPITGKNGQEPELIVPNIFANTEPHHLIITYDGLEIRFYTDKLQNLHSLKLNLGLTTLRYLSLPLPPLSGRKIRLDAPNTVFYKIYFYGLIFIPLGALGGLIAVISPKKSLFYLLLFCGGGLLPSLLLESLLANRSGREIRGENLLLSIAITVCTMLLVKVVAASWLKSNRH